MSKNSQNNEEKDRVVLPDMAEQSLRGLIRWCDTDHDEELLEEIAERVIRARKDSMEVYTAVGRVRQIFYEIDTTIGELNDLVNRYEAQEEEAVIAGLRREIDTLRHVNRIAYRIGFATEENGR